MTFLSELEKELKIDDYDTSISSKEMIDKCRAKGMIILFPEKDELFIDIDTEEQYQAFLKLIDSFNKNLLGEMRDKNGNFAFVEQWPSKSGLPRRHIVVHLPFYVTPSLRVAYQAALGSDPQRELLSLLRIFRNDQNPTIFVENAGFNKKEK